MDASSLIDRYCEVWSEPKESKRAELLSSVWGPHATYTDPSVYAANAEELLSHIANVQVVTNLVSFHDEEGLDPDGLLRSRSHDMRARREGDLLCFQGDLPDQLAHPSLDVAELPENYLPGCHPVRHPVRFPLQRIEDHLEAIVQILQDVVMVEGQPVSGVHGRSGAADEHRIGDDLLEAGRRLQHSHKALVGIFNGFSHGAILSYLISASSFETDAFAHALDRAVIHAVNLAEVLVGGVRLDRGIEMLADMQQLGIRVAAPEDGEPLRLATLRVTTGLKMPDCCVLDTAIAHQADLATVGETLAAAARNAGLQVLT